MCVCVRVRVCPQAGEVEELRAQRREVAEQIAALEDKVKRALDAAHAEVGGVCVCLVCVRCVLMLLCPSFLDCGPVYVLHLQRH